MALLIDSTARCDAAVWLDHGDRPASAGVAFARGYLHLERRELESARLQFARGQTLIRPGDDGLCARIALELGSLYLRADRPSTADTVLAHAESSIGRPFEQPDLVQLRALIADARGDRREARALLRRAIALPGGFTPQTRVLAMHNLAAALAHSEPDESVTLTSLALAQLESSALHTAMRPALRNVAGYAWICLGDLDQADALLVEAQREADAIGNDEISSYAQFNRGIAAELRGDVVEAAALIGALLGRVQTAHPALAVWCRLRLAWIGLIENDVARAETLVASALAGDHTISQEEAGEIIRTLALLGRGDARGAPERLASLARAAADRDDQQTAFALTLWQATAEKRAGRVVAATRLARAATALAAAHRFRWSPNWWTTDLAEVARRASGHPEMVFLPSCRYPEAPAPPHVHVKSDGVILVGALEVEESMWRSGRSGPRILRRLLRLLIAQHPQPVPRDRLCDTLWPESDGDRANGNLYAAANDLRKVLSQAPGLGLVTRDKAYALVVGENVTVDSLPRART